MKKKHSVCIPIVSVSMLVLMCWMYHFFCHRTGTLKDINDYNRYFPHQKIPFFATTGELYYAEKRSIFHRHDIIIFGELDKNLVFSNGNLFLSIPEDESAIGEPQMQEIINFPRCAEMVFEQIRYYFDMRLNNNEFYVPVVPNYFIGHLKGMSLTLHHSMLVSKKTNKFVLWIYEY